MYNIKRLYNQNKKKIWRIILIVTCLFILIQVLNYLARNNIKNEKDEDEITETQLINNSSFISSKSLVSGNNISEDTLLDINETMDNFIEFCNTRQYEQAYDMLTDDCKENVYNTLDSFINGYCSNIFNIERIYSIENWIGKTYKVRYTEDFLSTGIDTQGYAKQDYITFEKQDNVYKLNINNYVGKENIKKKTEENDITINVLSKNIFMTYEEYTIEVTNNNNQSILLDSMQNMQSLYLEDNNNMTYSSYNHEFTEPSLTVQAGETKEITIKFYNNYTSGRKIKYIVFSDLIMNYDKSTEMEKIEFKAKI